MPREHHEPTHSGRGSCSAPGMTQMATIIVETEQLQHSGRALLTKAPRWVWDVAAYLPAFVASPAIALGVAGLAGTGPEALKKRRGLSVAALLGGAALLARWQLGRWFLEEPDYRLVRRENGLELREYAPRVVAETVVWDALDWDSARTEGFTRLAAYIHGDNTRRHGRSGQAVPYPTRHERLPMTAPVTMRASPQGYVVTFGMPKGRTLSDLPDPNDTDVALRTHGSMRIAALRFRGSYDAELVANKEAELVLRAREAGLEIIGEPMFAGYDAPSTLPFLRRVEVWAPIA